ncbi:MAG TPA: phosphoglycerate kinase [Gaiellaceae bacterium]|nr:phosphoglycerate kinase [Gaiellaceae bacterium]
MTLSAPTVAPPARRPRSVVDADVAGKHVFVRADLNVPLEDGKVADDTRIRAALPTLELLRDRGAASITVCSHLGRPSGPDARYAMKPVARRLALLFDGTVEVLENTRFQPGETANDPAYAASLALGHDLFVEDAFGSVHRAHASTVGVAQLLPSYAGLLVEREVDHLSRLLGEVAHPFVIVAGGAKVDDKLPVLAHLGARADSVLVGGKIVERVAESASLPFEVELPFDVVAAPSLDAESQAEVFALRDVPRGWAILDIGPRAIHHFSALLEDARTIFWNGPLGVFERPRFSGGTLSIALAIAHARAYSVVGGADSLRALNESGLATRVSWASTGGGASLEFLAGKELPGLAVIPSSEASS